MTTQTSTTTSGDGLCSGVIDESTTRLGRNIVQVSICVIGAVALVMCAYVLTAIAAFRMDKVEQRYRLLAGIFVANIVYSVSNLFPYWYAEHDAQDDFLADPERGCIGRSLWVGGQFMLGTYELCLVYASLVALRYGTAIRESVELGCHILSATTFFVTATVFGIQCRATVGGDINSRSPPANASRDSAEYRCWLKWKQDLYRPYNDLLVGYIRGMVGLAAVIIVMWAVVRRHFSVLIRNLKRYTSPSGEDLSRVDRINRGTLAEAQNAGAREVAGPLSPYILMFVVFSVPMIIMSTDFCVDRSSTYSDSNPAGCNLPCEWGLSFRSLVSALIYFFIDNNGQQIVSPATLYRKLRTRWAGQDRVRFGTNEVRLLETRDPYTTLTLPNTDGAVDDGVPNGDETEYAGGGT